MIQLSTVSGFAVASPVAISLGKIIVISAVVFAIGTTLYLGSQAMLNIAAKVASVMQEIFSSRGRLSPYQQAHRWGSVDPLFEPQHPRSVIVVQQQTPLARPLHVNSRPSASHDQPGVRSQQGTPAIATPVGAYGSASSAINPWGIGMLLRPVRQVTPAVGQATPEVSATGRDIPGAAGANRT